MKWPRWTRPRPTTAPTSPHRGKTLVAQTGVVYAPDAIAAAVACPDCASYHGWELVADGLFRLHKHHDATCPYGGENPHTVYTTNPGRTDTP